jgi:hypothetical protein
MNADDTAWLPPHTHLFINYVVHDVDASVALIRRRIAENFRDALARLITSERLIVRRGYFPNTTEFAADLYVLTPEQFEKVVGDEVVRRLAITKP